MTVSEHDRLELYQAVEAAWGRRSAETLMEYLPPVGWGDVARRHDIDLLRADTASVVAELRGEMAELRSELRGEMAELRSDLRGEMSALRSELRVEIADGLNRILVWMVGVILASVGTVLGLIAFVS